MSIFHVFGRHSSLTCWQWSSCIDLQRHQSFSEWENTLPKKMKWTTWSTCTVVISVWSRIIILMVHSHESLYISEAFDAACSSLILCTTDINKQVAYHYCNQMLCFSRHVHLMDKLALVNIMVSSIKVIIGFLRIFVIITGETVTITIAFLCLSQSPSLEPWALSQQ